MFEHYGLSESPDFFLLKQRFCCFFVGLKKNDAPMWGALELVSQLFPTEES